MTNSALDLLPYFIGFNNRAPRFETNFPPYNIRKLTEDEYVLELAVAGFKKENIEIEVRKSVLTVSGSVPENEETYLHRGIARRSFSRSFVLQEHMKVESANMENGMLALFIAREIPEAEKPKLIPIG